MPDARAFRKNITEIARVDTTLAWHMAIRDAF
jgi:hypothetical protein